MSTQLPQSTDKLSLPDHAKSHRVVAIDNNAPDQAIVVGADGFPLVNSFSPSGTGYVKSTTGTGKLSIQASPIPATDGGTGATSAQVGINNLTAVQGATNEYILTKDTASGNAIFKAPASGYITESGSVDYLTTLANSLVVGANALLGTEKVFIKGLADVIQLIVKGYSTQTSNIIEVRKSDNTILFAVTNTAGITVGGASSGIGSNIANTPLIFTTALTPKVVTVTDGAGAVVDLSLGNTYVLTAAADRTLGTTTNFTNGQRWILRFVASGGARTLTLPNSTTGDFSFGSDITALTQTASGKTDYIGFEYNSTIARNVVIAVVKGY